MTISAATPFTVDASTIEANDTGSLDSSNAIMAYHVNPDGYAARVVQSDETVGAEFIIEALAAPGGRAVAIAGISAIRAIVIYRDEDVSATLRLQILNISGTTITSPGPTTTTGDGSEDSYSIVALSATSAIIAYADATTSGQGVAQYLTVSGNTITVESLVVFEASAASGIQDTALAKLSSTKAVVSYRDRDDSNQLKTVVLSISGTTISAGSSTTVDGGDASRFPSLAPISASQCLLAYANTTDTNLRTVVLSISGTTITENTAITVTENTVQQLTLAEFDTTQFAVCYTDSTDNDGKMAQVTVSGVTVSALVAVLFDSTAGVGFSAAAPFTATTVINAYNNSLDAVIITLAASTLGLAAMTKPADIDASGTFIYLALLEGGTPILTKISTALDADGSTVFDPGAGDNIGVECGRFDATVIWVGGNFDGTNTLEKSEDSGSTFVVKDDATTSTLLTFLMGPDSDDRILANDNGVDIIETIDSGATWVTINSGNAFDTNDIGRLGENVEESVFGNDGGATDSIHFSVNSGADLEDFMTGPYPNSNAKKVIVN